jgi:hypothetical protein
MKTTFKKAVLGTALAATAAVGVLAGATPAAARPWGDYRGEHHGGGAGIAIAAGLIGLVAGVAIASDHGHDGDRYVGPPPVAYAPTPVAYGGYDGCYAAYPGYDGDCYPAAYYVNLGWGWHDGGWWYGGSRYARPFVVGGYRGGYRGGYAQGGDYRGYRGGYAQGGEYRGDQRGYNQGGYAQGGNRGEFHGGYAQQGYRDGGRDGDHGHR